jgi:WD40 repeat protein
MLTAVNGMGGIVQCWEVPSGREQVILRLPSGVSSAAFSRDGRLLVTGGHDSIARIWDLLPTVPGRS